MTLGIFVILFVIAVVTLGEPLYVLIGGVAAILLSAEFGAGQELSLVENLDNLKIIIEMTRRLSDNEVLLAIPFFVISGAIMSEGDIATRLIQFAQAAFAKVPGGLAVSAVFACIFFAAISGSSPVTVIAIGSVMFPAMVKEGYSERFAAGLVTSAGSLGILIPPSIPMILYAIIDPTAFADPSNYELAADATGSGLVELFLAGVGPGLVIGVILAGYSVFEGRKVGGAGEKVSSVTRLRHAFVDIGRAVAAPFYASVAMVLAMTRDVVEAVSRATPRDRSAYAEKVTDAFYHGFWALMLPVVILGGIYAGIFTPTQAAAVSVVYALVVEFFIHRSITWWDIPRTLGDSAVLIGALLIIIALAQGFNKYLELAQVAEGALAILNEWQLSPVAFLLIVNLLLLVVGCFMDILSAILILVPLISPIAFQLGIHPMHLAIVFIVNLEIGYLTPPLGLNLFVASTMFNKSLGEMIRAVMPFTVLMLVGLMMITYIPTISLGLVSAKNGHAFYVPFPENHVALHGLETNEAIALLGGVAEREEELAAEEPEVEEPPRVLTMEEIMAGGQAALEEEAMNSLLYETPESLLSDYRLVYSGRVRLADLALFRDGGDGEEASDVEGEPGGEDGGAP